MIWSVNRSYHINSFKGCIPQILLGPFFNTLFHLYICALSITQILHIALVSLLLIVPVFLIGRSHFVLLLNIPIRKIQEEFWEKVSGGSHLSESLKAREKDVFN